MPTCPSSCEPPHGTAAAEVPFPRNTSEHPSQPAQALRAEQLHRYEQTIRRTILQTLRQKRVDSPEELIDDLLQDVYCHLLSDEGRRLRACRQSAEPSRTVYLCRTAERVTLDWVRRQTSHKRSYRHTRYWGLAIRLEELGTLSAEQDPEMRLLRRDSYQRLLKRMASSRPGRDLRQPLSYLWLSAVGELTCTEIAAASTSTTPGAVTAALARLKQQLRAVGELELVGC
jgi:hypothetical protein